MAGDWLYLDYDSPLRQELKRRYRVWGGREALTRPPPPPAHRVFVHASRPRLSLRVWSGREAPSPIPAPFKLLSHPLRGREPPILHIPPIPPTSCSTARTCVTRFPRAGRLSSAPLPATHSQRGGDGGGWAAQVAELGAGRRSGVPGLVVVWRGGEELQFLHTEARGAAALREWDLDAGRW